MSSKSIARFKYGKYLVTCVEYKPEETFPASYEIGLRDTSERPDSVGHFRLIQSDFFRSFNIKHYGSIAACMIGHGLTPLSIQTIFSNAESIDEEQKP